MEVGKGEGECAVLALSRWAAKGGRGTTRGEDLLLRWRVGGADGEAGEPYHPAEEARVDPLPTYSSRDGGILHCRHVQKRENERGRLPPRRIKLVPRAISLSSVYEIVQDCSSPIALYILRFLFNAIRGIPRLSAASLVLS